MADNLEDDGVDDYDPPPTGKWAVVAHEHTKAWHVSRVDEGTLEGEYAFDLAGDAAHYQVAMFFRDDIQELLKAWALLRGGEKASHEISEYLTELGADFKEAFARLKA